MGAGGHAPQRHRDVGDSQLRTVLADESARCGDVVELGGVAGLTAQPVVDARDGETATGHLVEEPTGIRPHGTRCFPARPDPPPSAVEEHTDRRRVAIADVEIEGEGSEAGHHAVHDVGV